MGNRVRQRGGRSERRRQRAEKVISMVQPVHNIPIYELVNAEGIELIHQKSLEILQEVGIDFYLDEALSILKEHGVDVRGETAHFDADLNQEYVAKAPNEFAQLAQPFE